MPSTLSLPVEKTREVLKHVTALDGIRGTALLAVVMYHLLWTSPQANRMIAFITGLRTAGWVGVDLFFSLSGFLITGILVDSLAKPGFFRNFYARRVLRIFPLYYGVIALLFVICTFVVKTSYHPLYLLLGYLQNTPLWWNDKSALRLSEATAHLWSLAVEEQFYMVWPVVVFLVREKKRLLWISLGLSVAALATRIYMVMHGSSAIATYTLTICRADSLLGGASLALLLRMGYGERIRRWAAPVFFAAVAVCLFMAWKAGNFDWRENRELNLYGFTVLAIGSAAVIAMSLRDGSAVSRVMNLRVLRFFGKYSYGLYVYHQLIQDTIYPYLYAHFRNVFRSQALVRMSMMCTVLAITIPLAMASFKFYEMPFLKLKRFFNPA